jgi:hypothetical protein
MVVTEERSIAVMAEFATAPPPGRAWPRLRRRVLLVATLAAVGIVLTLAYLPMSRTQAMNADGASQALQGWDLLHGNLLLRGWTASDVSFYGNELWLFAAVEAVRGLDAIDVHLVAAILYALLVLAVAALARGRTTGRVAVASVAVAVAVLLVPAAGLGSLTLLLSPDHTGTCVPLLLTWLVIQRGLAGRPAGQAARWLPYAVGVMLVWGQVPDPLVLYIGALPVALTSLARLARRRVRAGSWRGLWWGAEARLFVAAVASVVVSRAIMLGLRASGGLWVHVAPVKLVAPSGVGRNLRLAGQTLAVDFGAYLPDRHGPLDVAVGCLRLVGLAAALVALVAVLWSAARAYLGRATKAGADGTSGGEAGWFDGADGWVNEILAVGILVNLGAFVVSTLPADLTSGREVVAVLVFGAVLAGRVLGPRLARVRALPVVLAVMLLGYGGEFVARTAQPAATPTNGAVAQWLDEHSLTYGLGGFWTANDITLLTGGRVHVAPITGTGRVYGYRWESTMDWYDPARHDARFLLVQRVVNPDRVPAALSQFGTPRLTHDVGGVTILVYDHNLLSGLPVG